MKREKTVRTGNKEKRLPIVFRRKLLTVTAFIMLFSMAFIALITPLLKNLSVLDILSPQLSEIKEEVVYNSDFIFDAVKSMFMYDSKLPDEEFITSTLEYWGSPQWYVIDENGTVIMSDDKSKINTTVPEDSVIGGYHRELSDTQKGSCRISDIPSEDFQSGNWEKYVAASLGNGAVMVVIFDSSTYYPQTDGIMESVCSFKTVGKNGCDLIVHQDGTIISPPEKIRTEKNNKLTQSDIKKLLSAAPENSLLQVNLQGTEYCAIYQQADGYYAVSIISKNEVMLSLYIIILVSMFLMLLLLVIVFLRVNGLTKRLIVDNIGKINSELSEITGGNLDVEIDVKDNLEFRQLSDGINTTVSSLKGYIARESERFNKELELARAIQTSALPNVFPPYPNRHDIDVYASMNPAKQVGGDFYDFFFIDSTHFAFLVADVSDKGIPAAMFMMKAKTIIKSLAQANRSADEIICIANNALCEDNEADMFVTLWFGILDTDKGLVSYINAGHCKPLIRRSGTGFEFVRERPDFVVAGEESVPYTRRELKLCSGDALFLYTDGVTEAVDISDELYGDDRLQTALNAQSTSSARGICETVRKDLTLYSDGATQTDDITMLAVVFNGMRLYREITVEAKVERLSEVNAFLEEQLDASEFDMRSATQICVIADDVCSNIVYYAYPDKDSGMMKVAFSFDPKTDEAEITFTDSGIPFNPLNVPEPDISKIEEGDEGGLGIMLVRKFSDKLLYEYSNGQNILKIIKKRNRNKTE